MRCRGEWLFAPTNSARCPLPRQSRRGVLSRAAVKWATRAGRSSTAPVVRFAAALDTSSCTLRCALSWVSGLLLGSLGRRSLSGSARLILHRRTGGGVLCLSPFVGSPSPAGSIRDVSRRTRHNEFAPVLLLGRSGTDLVPCVPGVYERGLVLVCGRVSSGSSELDSGVGWISSVCFPSSVRAVGSALRKYVFWVGLCRSASRIRRRLGGLPNRIPKGAIGPVQS